jgi:glycerol-3-phosphate acyltransferase PlsY
MMDVYIHSLAIVAAYLLGAIPFGLLFARMLSDVDPREHGSGNIGATNAMRSGGKLVGILTLLADIAKASLPVALGIALDWNDAWIAALGLASLVGHCFPVWLRFKGGKGVATMFGVLIPWMPGVALATFILWFLVYKISRYVSLASIIAALSIAPWVWFSDGTLEALWSGFFIGALVTIRHISNIKRLLEGTESRAVKKTQA